jgi:hypothetical protein
MAVRRFRLDVIGGLLVLITVAAFLLGEGRFFRKRPDPLKRWPTFAVPDGGFTVHFPTATPAEADLTGYMIDPAFPSANEMSGMLHEFVDTGGKIRGWSAEDGSTRYSIRIQLPKSSRSTLADALRQLMESDKNLSGSVTNLPVVEERKTLAGDLNGRYFLATRPNGNRVLTYMFYQGTRGVFLFVERPNDSLTIEDSAARQFFKSVVLTKK